MQKRELKFGIEIEFFGMDRNEAITILKNIGLNFSHNGEPTNGNWVLKHDGSVSQEGLELVSPILFARDLFLLKKVLNTLKAAGGKVNSTCGIHIHHDATGLTVDNIKKMILYYTANKQVFNAIMTKSRVSHCQYCKHYTKSELHDVILSTSIIQIASNVDRYRVINTQAYVRHRSIEFRQHYGSLDFDKIINWIILTNQLIRFAIDDSQEYSITNIRDFKFFELSEAFNNVTTDLNLNNGLIHFIEKRIEDRQLLLA